MPATRACAQRVREQEIMDDPGLDQERHFEALRGLASLNWISGSARAVWKPIKRFARESNLRRLRILDVASGGGDVAIGLWKKAQRTGLDVEVVGVDLSPRAIEFAQHRAAEAGANVRFEALDVLADELPNGFDIMTCSLFLHHLSNAEAKLLLEKMSAAAGRMVVINDLYRSRWNLFLVWLGTWLFTRSDVARVDGPLSVKAAFIPQEVRALAEEAGLAGARVYSRWPCRLLLEWRKP